MKVFENGAYRSLTTDEIAEYEAEEQRAEAEYWRNVDYNEAVEAEIAKRYTIGQELAIQRQRDKKPEEYEAYYAYCEECKTYVKEKKGV
jgi:hypothetical protein